MSGKPISVGITLSSTTLTTSTFLQFALDDIQQTTSSAVVWFNTSSTAYSSAIADTGATASFLNPVAGLRLSSTALSSGSVTMRILQGIGR
jgi:hypothetical protein